VMDKVSHPNTVTAKVMGLTDVKQRWKAVPRNQPFLTGEDYEATEKEAVDEPLPAAATEVVEQSTSTSKKDSVSQWLKGKEAHELLKASPADALIIADDENPIQAVMDLLPLVALCGHVVVFSNFLENLTEIYSLIRNDCINIQISETWYRHHQVLSNRTHPTVNMSTAGGYLLTAVRVEKNSAPRPRYTVITDEAFAKYNTGSGKVASKRPREE
jgi:tRNA (adenine58-N1)-methyltransferase non-catalytic subunit